MFQNAIEVEIVVPSAEIFLIVKIDLKPFHVFLILLQLDSK